jgi:CRP-like cAMP-binding protein
MPVQGRLSALRSQVRNRILLALPEQEFQHILPHLAFVGLRQGQLLYNADNWIDYAYFINSGMTSLVTVTAEGQTVEIGTVGHEGLMGTQAALGEDKMFYSGTVQIPGNAMRIGSQALRYEFQHSPRLAELLLDYMLQLHLQLRQSALCSSLHSLEQRLCRWLLTSQDCARSSSFPFTHEFLSHMVGTTRTTVSLTAEALQEAGLILYRRSHIRIIDREGMKRKTCDCYRIVSDRVEHPSAA